MKTDPVKIEGFWTKKENQYWNRDIYTPASRDWHNKWANGLYKKNIKADFIKK